MNVNVRPPSKGRDRDHTRQDMIERYITIRALECLLANLLDVVRPTVAVPKEAVGDNLLLVGRDGVTGDDLWEQLWPEDEDRDRPEYLLQNARSDVLVAQIAARLAVSSEGLVEISDRLSGIAREDLASPELAKAARDAAQESRAD